MGFLHGAHSLELLRGTPV